MLFRSADEIFDRPRADMVNTRLAVGGRRPLEKDKVRAVGVGFLGFVEDVVVVPEPEDLFLGRGYGEVIFEAVEFHISFIRGVLPDKVKLFSGNRIV